MSIYQEIKCLLGQHESANYYGEHNWCDHCRKELPNACKKEGHDWEVPHNGCCGYQYGTRVCKRCKRNERLILHKDGREEWYCMEERWKKVMNTVFTPPPEQETEHDV